eukprot:COSAG06_NODE_2808_length_6249_cov_12.456585_2_plen_99_part_00
MGRFEPGLVYILTYLRSSPRRSSRLSPRVRGREIFLLLLLLRVRLKVSQTAAASLPLPLPLLLLLLWVSKYCACARLLSAQLIDVLTTSEEGKLRLLG